MTSDRASDTTPSTSPASDRGLNNDAFYRSPGAKARLEHEIARKH